MNINFLKLKIILKSEENIRIENFPGFAIRGMLGTALYKSCCDLPLGKHTCKSCEKNKKCLYALMFETSKEHFDFDIDKRYHDISRPYWINVKSQYIKNLNKNAILEFEFNLCDSRLIDNVQYIINTIKKAGKNGLGINRGKFQLYKVFAIQFKGNQQEIFSENKFFEDDYIDLYNFEFGENTNNIEKNKIKIRFITPLDIRRKGKLIPIINFKNFFFAGYRTLNSLIYFYSDYEMSDDLKKISEICDNIEISDYNIIKKKMIRKSTAQSKKIRFDVFTGNIEYTGDKLKLFYKYIKLFSLINIGKGRVFGLGNFEMNI